MMSDSESYIPNIVVGGGFGGPGDLSRRCPVVLFGDFSVDFQLGKESVIAFPAKVLVLGPGGDLHPIEMTKLSSATRLLYCHG